VAAHKFDRLPIEQGPADLTAALLYGVAYRPVAADVIFAQPKETLALGPKELTVLHAPGHTPGSIVVAGEFDGLLVLFAQDLHGPFDPAWGSDVAQWRRTARMLLELEADVLCEGHLGVFRPKDKVRRYMERCLEANAEQLGGQS